jgi:hypothetical protein
MRNNIILLALTMIYFAISAQGIKVYAFGDPGQDNDWVKFQFPNLKGGDPKPATFDKFVTEQTVSGKISTTPSNVVNIVKVLEVAKAVIGTEKDPHVCILGDMAYNEAKYLPAVNPFTDTTKPDVPVPGVKYYAQTTPNIPNSKRWGWSGADGWTERAINLFNKIHDAFVDNIKTRKLFIVIGNHQFDSDAKKLLERKGEVQHSYIGGEKNKDINGMIAWYDEKGPHTTENNGDKDYLIKFPRTVTDGNTLFLDLNMSIQNCSYSAKASAPTATADEKKADDAKYAKFIQFFSLGSYTADQLRTICQNYGKATEHALAVIKENKTVKWKVLRSHETPYNIEGDVGSLQTMLVPELIKAGIHVNIGSHFHTAAVLYADDSTKLKGTPLPDKVAGVKLDKVDKDGKPVYVTANAVENSLAVEIDKTSGFAQIIIGHSGRFLDPLYPGDEAIAETPPKYSQNSRTIWARARDFALTDVSATPPKNGHKNPVAADKFGFAVIDFQDGEIIAKFYHTVQADLAKPVPEATVSLKMKTTRRRQMKRKQQKRAAAKKMKKHMKNKKNKKLRRKLKK